MGQPSAPLDSQCISFSYYVSQVCFRLDSWYRKWPLTKKSNDSEPSDFLLPAMAKTYTSVKKIKAFQMIFRWIEELIENTIIESNLACSWTFRYLITHSNAWKTKITSFLLSKTEIFVKNTQDSTQLLYFRSILLFNWILSEKPLSSRR